MVDPPYASRGAEHRNIAASDDANLGRSGTVRISKVPGGHDAVQGVFFERFAPVPTGATGTATYNDDEPPLQGDAFQVAARRGAAGRGVMRRWLRP